MEAGKLGLKTASLATEEHVIAQNLATFADLGYIFDNYELRLFINSYSEQAGHFCLNSKTI